jgi:GNAT superfamily N-acetyltransferase
MDTILQEISASIIPPAMDANKIAFGALLGTLPHAAFHDEPGLSRVENCFMAYSGLLFRPQSLLRMYLGTIAEEPVATVSVFFGAGVAALEHVVTVPQARGRGVGGAITLMAAREAHEQGYRVGVLTSSPMGFNIYRRIGFREYCTFSTYEWSPETFS